LTGRSLNIYWRDPEFRMFIFIQLGLAIGAAVSLIKAIFSLMFMLYIFFSKDVTSKVLLFEGDFPLFD
ncbi:hypothetical protein C1T29_04520, partial [Bacillus sp. MBGLi79]